MVWYRKFKKLIKAFPALWLVISPCAYSDFFISKPDLELQAKIDEFSNRTLVVGMPKDHIPFAYYSDSYQTHVGFAVSLARALCADMNASCTYRYMGAYELIQELLMGRVNFTISPIFSSDQMFETFAYTHPVLRAHPVLVTTDFGLNFASLLDLKSYNVGVRFASPEQKIMEAERINSHISYYTIYSSYAEMFEALEQGRVDVLYLDNLTAYGFIKKRNLMLYVCADKFNNTKHYSNIGMMVSKIDAALLYRLNLSLDRLKTQGRIHHLALEYFHYLDVGY